MKATEYRNVCEVIVKNDLCIGCGLCAGVCPPQVLRMDFNEMGEYQASEFKPGCLPNCNLCLEVCPFWDQNQNEDDLGQALYSRKPDVEHRPETGYFLECFAGYSQTNRHREQGASGGMITWVLEALLERRWVDRVICVSPNPDPQKLYQFRVCSTVDEIRNASRSDYYPVELSSMIRYILENEGKYAITGLPCFIKGLRLAMNRIPKLHRRIIFLLGLTCSQTQSKLYAEYLCQKIGGDPARMDRAVFRVKDPQRPANDYGFRFESNSGKVREGEIFFKEGLGEVWLNGYFTPNACLHCDDMFAETADAAFMDAWLLPYQSDPRGHNLVLARSQAILDLLKEGVNCHQLALQPIGVAEVIRSQAGGLKRKRQILALRTSRQRKQSKDAYLPRKRFVSTEGLELEEKLLYLIREVIRKQYRSKYHNERRLMINSPLLALLRLAVLFIVKISFIFRLARAAKKNIYRQNSGD